MTPLRVDLIGNVGLLRALATQHPDRYPALLESVAATQGHTRSILFGGITGALTRRPDGSVDARGIQVTAGTTFLEALEIAWLESRRGYEHATPHQELPFIGGWVVLAGYELAQEVEPRLVLPRSAQPIDSVALRATTALIYDHAQMCLTAVAEPSAHTALDELVADVRAATHRISAAWSLPIDPRPKISEEADAKYLRGVERTKEYIAAGDVYQVNLSRLWTIDYATPVPVMALYERLRVANPAPFAACLQWEGMGVVSSSPERLLAIEGRDISTRPIAGTRSRTHVAGADAAETRELVAHPKERAEHVMLIDLERNDLGRVCEGGSVRVDEFMVTESYAHVHHIVSNVRGRLRAAVTPIAALRAMFPGGTITGCPKFRCMQIIAELEGAARGPYTGSLGYLSLDGRADFNILIRTMIVNGTRVGFRAGAGIVADSIPERELEETRAKARGLLAAIDPRMAAPT